MGTIQGAQRTMAASKDHTGRWIQHRPFILPNRTRGGSFSEGQGARRAEPRSAEQPQDGTSGAALPGGNQDVTPRVRRGRDAQAGVKALLFPAVVALQWQSCFPALMMFYLATRFLRCFGLLPFLTSFYLNHAAVIHSHLFSLFIFLSIQGKSTYRDCKRL